MLITFASSPMPLLLTKLKLFSVNTVWVENVSDFHFFHEEEGRKGDFNCMALVLKNMVMVIQAVIVMMMVMVMVI